MNGNISIFTKNKSLLLPLVLFCLVLLLYWKMFSYPYIQDDWTYLHYFSFAQDRMDVFDHLVTFFSDSDDKFYRPLAKLYFYSVIRVFGANPIGFRIIDVAMIFCTALVIKAIAFRLLKNEALAWFSGAYYVFSATVLMDPLMWMVGMFDLAGVFFFLASFLLFLKEKKWPSAFCYLVAILFKEGPIVLPLVLVLSVLLIDEKVSSESKKIAPAVKRILPHLIVLLIYSCLRFEDLLARLDATSRSPYKMDFWGTHIVTNILKYAVWSVEGLTGISNLHEKKLYALLILLIGLSLIVVLGIRIRRNSLNGKILVSRFSENFGLILFSLLWGVLCLLSVLFLPNHAYRYYLIYSFPPLILFLVILIDLALHFYERKGAILLVALFLIYVSNFATFHFFLSKGLRAPVLSGSNALVQRGDTVKLMRSYVEDELQSSPENPVFVFDGVKRGERLYRGIDSIAFRGKHFLQYIYQNPSIDVIDLRGQFYGDLKRKRTLFPEQAIVLGLKDGKITRYELEEVYNRDSDFYADKKLFSRQQ